MSTVKAPPVTTGVEKFGWLVAVVVAGLLVPGLGLALALILAGTRLRDSRWFAVALVVLGAALVLAVFGSMTLGGGMPQHSTVRVR